MSVISEIFAGGASGVIGGIGDLALKLRTAITGKAALDSTDQIKLLELANEMDKLNLNATTMLTNAQLEINKAEASSTSTFKGGWRPFIGWVCGTGLAYDFIFRPIVPWFVQVTVGLTGSTYILPLMPVLDLTQLMPLVLGMLGLGAARTIERLNGKA